MVNDSAESKWRVKHQIYGKSHRIREYDSAHNYSNEGTENRKDVANNGGSFGIINKDLEEAGLCYLSNCPSDEHCPYDGS